MSASDPTAGSAGQERLVAAVALQGTITGGARSIGLSRDAARRMMAKDPALDVTVRAHLRPRLTPEEAKRRDDAAKKRYSLEVYATERIEAKRAANRRWARNQDPAKRRRWNIYNRDRRRAVARPDAAALDYDAIVRMDPCSYCGAPGGTTDHVEPIVSGGEARWWNLTSACHTCNSTKGTKPLLTFLADRATTS